MYPSDPNLYDEYYFKHSCGPPYERNERWLRFFGEIAEEIVRRVRPRTALDAGCAMGMVVEQLRDRNVEAFGIDISEYALRQVREDIRPYCWRASLVDPLPRQYDLIICIEVLEHLPSADAGHAIANLCKYSNDILFSSTPIDYRESTHINVQPPEYWVRLFAYQGFLRDLDFDATFILPWAMRFRKTTDSITEVAPRYERFLWKLAQENNALRESSIELHKNLAESEKNVQTLTTSVEEKERTLHTIKMQLDQREQALRAVKVQLDEREQALQATTMQLEQIEKSQLWRLALKVRQFRLRFVPPGSRREHLLGAVLRLVRSMNTRETIG